MDSPEAPAPGAPGRQDAPTPTPTPTPHPVAPGPGRGLGAAGAGGAELALASPSPSPSPGVTYGGHVDGDTQSQHTIDGGGYTATETRTQTVSTFLSPPTYHMSPDDASDPARVSPVPVYVATQTVTECTTAQFIPSHTFDTDQAPAPAGYAGELHPHNPHNPDHGHGQYERGGPAAHAAPVAPGAYRMQQAPGTPMSGYGNPTVEVPSPSTYGRQGPQRTLFEEEGSPTRGGGAEALVRNESTPPSRNT